MSNARIHFYFREPTARVVEEAEKDFSNPSMKIEATSGAIVPLNFEAIGGSQRRIVQAVAVTITETNEVASLIASLTPQDRKCLLVYMHEARRVTPAPSTFSPELFDRLLNAIEREHDAMKGRGR